MAFKFFRIPIQNPEPFQEELNAFLGGHRVLAVDRRWVDQGPSSFWSLCIDYVDGASSGTGGARRQRDRSKVDYRDVLSPEDFSVYAKLRDLRKEVAQAEAVPVYTLFTNEQLAQMVQKRAGNKADLESIDGIGEARVEKYGPRFIEFLRQQWSDGDAKGGEPV